MQINRRITNGLAWAGLFIVVAVPVADAISGQLMGGEGEIALASVGTVSAVEMPVPAPLSQRPSVPAARPVIETAAVVPAKPVAAKPAVADPVVDSFLSSGRKLPSYITGGDDEPVAAVTTPTSAVTPPIATAPVAKPAAVAPVAQAPAVDPVEVAALTPARVAPVPMPLSMRPAPITRPIASRTTNDAIVLPPEVVARNNAAMVVDDLRDWESGPLSDFLARRQQGPSAQAYDSDGFFLSDGPNNRGRRDVYVGPVIDDGYYPFGN